MFLFLFLFEITVTGRSFDCVCLVCCCSSSVSLIVVSVWIEVSAASCGVDLYSIIVVMCVVVSVVGSEGNKSKLIGNTSASSSILSK